MGGARGEEELVGGRVGRFNRRFEGMGGSRSGSSSLDWMEMGEEAEGGAEADAEAASETNAKARGEK